MLGTCGKQVKFFEGTARGQLKEKFGLSIPREVFPQPGARATSDAPWFFCFPVR
jgi:hypothetical protein